MYEFTIRSASLNDVAAMAQLREASDWQGGAEAEIMGRYLAGEHDPQHAGAPRAAFLAESSGVVVGYIAGHRTTRLGCEGELQWLLVAQGGRGKGVAARLLDALAAWFVGEGAARVCVNVAPENVRARRCDARHGALVLSEYWMAWPDIAAICSAGTEPRMPAS